MEENEKKVLKHYLKLLRIKALLSSSSSPKLENGNLWLARPPLKFVQ